jgi:hypothetical protein
MRNLASGWAQYNYREIGTPSSWFCSIWTLKPGEIWEADRKGITAALMKPGSVARNKRGALGVNCSKRIGKLVWKRP